MKSAKLKTHPKTATDNHPPTFSIITPTYNRADLLPRAVNSVLAQTYPDFEQIIVDDGSTDNTRQVIEGFQGARIKYLYQAQDGAAAARNAGVAASIGKWLIFLDSDDEVLPEWLAHFAQAIETQQRIGIVCCGGVWVREQGKQIKEEIVLPKNMGPLFDDQQGLFLNGAYAVRRKLFVTVGGYAARCRASQITELSLRLVPYCLEQGWTIHSLPFPLVRFFRHDNTHIRKDSAAILQGTTYILQQHGEMILRKEPRVYALFCAVAGTNAVRLGEYGRARHFFRAAIRAYPWQWKHYGRLSLALVPPLGRIFWLRKNKTT